MGHIRILSGKKRIALVAHDNKKKDLIEWAYYNRTVLSRHELFATGTTGKLIEEKLNQPVKKLLSGPLGGDQQMGAMVAEERLDMMVFFWDPMEAQPHDPSENAKRVSRSAHRVHEHHAAVSVLLSRSRKDSV